LRSVNVEIFPKDSTSLNLVAVLGKEV